MPYPNPILPRKKRVVERRDYVEPYIRYDDVFSVDAARLDYYIALTLQASNPKLPALSSSESKIKDAKEFTVPDDICSNHDDVDRSITRSRLKYTASIEIYGLTPTSGRLCHYSDDSDGVCNKSANSEPRS